MYFLHIHISFILLIYLSSSSILAQNPNKDEFSAEFVIRLRVSDIPGNEFTVRVTGEMKNFTDAVGGIHPFAEFLGIKFAIPPVNSLRFQRPTLDKPVKDFQASKIPPPCPQLGLDGFVVGNEDCLYLNIYLPRDKSQSNLANSNIPVLVWFHGESLEKSEQGILDLFSSGSSSELEPEIFIQHNILVVAPQYRLGSLGFLTTANEDLNGNMGLFDQLLALEWVQRYISDFGGDPNHVTLLGHGSSAISLGLLATSDLSKGLFHRMIMMSGSALSPFAVDTSPKATFTEIALQNSCPAFPTLRFARCMERKTFQNIVQADGLLTKGKHLGKFRNPHPVIQRDPDGRFLPPILSRSPLNSLTSGNFEHVPIIIGVSSAEMGGFLSHLSGKEKSEIPTTILANGNILNSFIRAAVSRSGGNPDLMADLIGFEYFAGLNVSDPLRAEQAMDILEEVLSDYLFHIPGLSLAKLWSRYAPVHFYVFDYVASSPERVYKTKKLSNELNTFIQASHGSDIRFLMEGYEGSAKDREVSSIFMDFWISFIHKGSPLHSGLEWPQFREDTLNYLHIRDQVQISSGFRKRKDTLLNTLMGKITNHICSHSTTTSVRGRAKPVEYISSQLIGLPYSQNTIPIFHQDNLRDEFH